MAGEAERNAPQVYTLTQLTRAAGQSRRVVVAGFDLPLRGMIITIAAIVVSLIPTLILWMFVGQLALVVPVLVIGAAFYLVESRSRSGLHLRTYQVMADKRRANLGKFICCGKEVDPSMTGFGMILQSSMRSPYLPDRDRELNGLFSADLADEPDPVKVLPSATRAEGETSPPASAKARRPKRRPRGTSDPFALLLQDNEPRQGEE